MLKDQKLFQTAALVLNPPEFSTVVLFTNKVILKSIFFFNIVGNRDLTVLESI